MIIFFKVFEFWEGINEMDAIWFDLSYSSLTITVAVSSVVQLNEKEILAHSVL